jgi:hypothetical protein
VDFDTAIQVSGTFTITGGTGRFDGATGAGTISGTEVVAPRFSLDDLGDVAYRWTGTITY